ncbi:MoaD/ThiS family protein [Streptomyces sp. NPDC059009]|uniref:MoaD/ThiS family protein n=1 Tax=Streptomyces sp. NPDC059009 TaxID=3346694 RepID=UPI00367E9E8B
MPSSTQTVGADLQSVDETVPAPVVAIRLPAAFHALTGGQRQISGAGKTIGEVLRSLDQDFPGVIERIIDAEGAVKRYVNVYRNDTDIRSVDGLDTEVAQSDVVWIIPAVAGGCRAGF